MAPGPPTTHRKPRFSRIETRVPSALTCAAVVVFVLSGSCRGTPSPQQATPKTPGTTEGDDPSEDQPRAPSEHSTLLVGGEPAGEVDGEPPRRPHHLESFFRALSKAEDRERNRRVRILHLGDSHTASDTITGRIRRLLQDKFGAAGRGYAYPGTPWRTFRQEQMYHDMSRHWTTTLGTDSDTKPPFAGGGLRLESSHEEAWLERGACGLGADEKESADSKSDSDADKPECPYGTELDAVSIFYLVQNGGGSFVVTVDGEDPTVVDTSGDEYEVGVYRRELEPGRRRIRIALEGDGIVSLFGIRTTHGENGIEYSSLGINGATATEFTRFDQPLRRHELEHLDPDLLVFAFGTNEAYDVHRMHEDPDVSMERVTQRLADYQFEFDRLLDQFTSAAPQSSCLVMLPPDTVASYDDERCRRRVPLRGSELCLPPTIRSYSGIVATQRAAARRHGCAVWDQSKAMGGEGSVRYWAALEPPLAQSDGVHLTMDGYHLLGEGFFADLMRSYDGWSRGNQAPLETRQLEKSAHQPAAHGFKSGAR